jgi:hypothetical protein
VLSCLVLLKQSVNISTLASFASITELVCKKMIRALSSVLARNLELAVEPVRLMPPSLANYLADQNRCTDSRYLVSSHVRHQLTAAVMRYYIETKDARLLDEVVDLDHAVLELGLCSDNHEQRGMSCVSLANALRNWYSMVGNNRMLEEVIRFCRRACTLCPISHPDCASSCASLAVSLWPRYNQSGEASLLGEAITLAREPLELRPIGHPDRAS